MTPKFTPRLYQETIFNTCSKKNTLVVLPTGMGKTNIFLMLAAHRLKLYPQSKIMFLGPTKPLIDQYKTVFLKNFDLPEEEVAVFTGNVKPDKRAEMWKTSRIIFSTPQGVENDIISGRIKLEEVSLLGIDEAHRAVGDYAYVFVAKQYMKKARYPKILGLTASPGDDLEKISEICGNLYIEDIEARNDEDPDVKPYVQDMNIKWEKVELNEALKDVQKNLKLFLKDRASKLKEYGVLHRKDLDFISKTDMLKLQAQLRGQAASGEQDFVIWNAISVLAEIMKMSHALELLESQSVHSCYTYLQDLNKEGFNPKSKAVKNIVKDLYFRTALIKLQRLTEANIEHPKLEKLKEIVTDELHEGAKIMIFNQYRDNAQKVVEELNKIPGVNAKLFVGQMKKGETGLSQKKQKEVIDEFREGVFNTLVATSVGEEGLDIPQVDSVIFYEPVPSAIRTIQRRGRTGRQAEGFVKILMTTGTRDEAYRWTAHHKEKRMHRILNSLKTKLTEVITKKAETLEKYIPEKEGEVKIYADHREKGAGVIKELSNIGVQLKLEKLESADYVLSTRVGVEFKTVEDFVNSIIDGRMLEQAKELKRNFEKPLLIIEGTDSIYSIRNIHANAIRGMLATITVSFGIPILQTKDHIETASLLYLIAKREQEETGKDFNLHGSKKPLTIKEQQEYIVSALPNVGPTHAKTLLKEFGSVSKVLNAETKELEKVPGVGKKIAENIRNIIDRDY